MLNRSRSLLFVTVILSVITMGIATSSWAASPIARGGSPCDESLLDIAIAASSSRQSQQDIMLTQRWENARATYERDLDFAAIDTKQLPQDYSPLRDVIEAKYRLAHAEGKLIVPDSDKEAIVQLQQAQSFLAHAIAHADTGDRARFTAIKNKVDRLTQFVSHGGGCWSERLSNAFDTIDYDIEDILHSS